MQRKEFSYYLPPELIAQYPLEQRTASRLLCLNGDDGSVQDLQFSDLLSQLQPNDLLVFNNTKVMPARLYGHKETGGKIEVLIERIISKTQVVAQVKASKAPQAASLLFFANDVRAQLIGREGQFFILSFHLPAQYPSLFECLEAIGKMPLPPYIKRDAKAEDTSRYQTVYAQHLGSVAAPTAGLHFDDALLQAIKVGGIETAEVTLHVGAGTYQPVRVDDITQHKMHHEHIDVAESVVDKIKTAKAKGGRVIAVGTTSARCLEAVSYHGEINAYAGETDIFIYPGYQFQCVDALITNFHLPESTLLMLLCAFAGRKHVLQAYQHAIKKAYRFFSYGDAMFVTRNKQL